MRHQIVDDLVAEHIPEKAYAEQWDTEGLTTRIQEVFDLDLPVGEWAAEEGIAHEEIPSA
jgi:preprotein translocase subunit SecA